MPALLVEATSGPAGFGHRPGFAFGWGNGSPIHTWEMLAGGDVGHSDMSFGAFIHQGLVGPDGGCAITDGVTQADVDYIASDRSNNIVYSGVITREETGWATDVTNSDTPSRDMYIGGGAPNPVPLMLGGNALTTIANQILPGDPGGFNGFFYDSGTGNYTVTGVGFQPDLVVFLSDTSDPFVGSGLRVMVGMMDAAGNQWVCSELGVNDTGPTITGAHFGYAVRMSEFRSDACFLSLPDIYGQGSSTMGRNRASFVSMDSDGFTIHMDELNSNLAFGSFLAYKLDDPTKGFFQVGTHVQGDTDLGTYPLDPEGVILVGDSYSASIDGTPTPVWTDAPYSTRAVLSVGGFDGITNRATVGGCGSGTGTNPGQYYDDSAIIFGDTNAQTTLARAVGNLGTLSASLSWTDDDGGARPFGSLAFRCPNIGLLLGPPSAISLDRIRFRAFQQGDA